MARLICLTTLDHRSQQIKKAPSHLLFDTNWYIFTYKYRLVYNVEPDTRNPTPDSKSMKKAARTRQFIIEQTAPIFNKKGFAGTSLSDLTLATGLTKGSIYGNFKNKDEVAIAAFEHNIGKIESLLRQLMAEAPSPLDKLKAYVAFYRSPDLFPTFKLGCPIVNAAPEADDTHPLLKEKVNQTILRWDTNIQTLIRKGIEAGQIKQDTEASSFSARMIALIEGGSLISKSTGDWRFLEEALQQLEDSISAISQ